MENKENNKLIAHFMGANNSDFGDYMIFTIGNPQSVGKINHSDIKYHCDWNWLIPVLLRIANFKFEDDTEIGDGCYLRTFGMRNNEDGGYMVRLNRMPLFTDEKLIDAAYKSVLNFIEYYNKNYRQS